MVATDLEALWAGPFGDAYTERNRAVGANRGEFWRGMQTGLFANQCLEIGCNVGANLQWFRPGSTFGVDVNRAALAEAERVAPGRVSVASAEALPFGAGAFDLVFTCGLLIHIRRDRLSVVLQEIARVSRNWVLLMEYESLREEAVPWRGQSAALWRAPYGYHFEEQAPEFRLDQYKFLPRGLTEFDDVTLWLFRKRMD